MNENMKKKITFETFIIRKDTAVNGRALD